MHLHQISKTYALIYIVWSSSEHLAQALDIRIGQLGYENSSFASTVVQIVARELHNARILPPNVTFSYHGRQMQPCDEYKSIAKAVDLYFNESVDVFLGPTCNNGVRPVALFAVYFNVPIIGYSATAPDLGDKLTFKTLARVSPSQDNFGTAITGMVRHLRWKRAGLIRMNTKSGGCDQFETVVRQLSDSGVVNLVVDVQVTTLNETDNLPNVLAKIKSSARIIFMCLVYKINTQPLAVTTRDVLLKAQEMNMTSPEYAYIVPNLLNILAFAEDPWIAIPSDGKDNIARQAFQSVILLEPEGQQKSLLDTLDALIMKELDLHSTAVWYSATLSNVNYTVTIALPYQYLYDAVYLYGLAVNKTYSNGRYDLSGLKIFQNTKCQSFDGFSGRVLTNSVAERIDTYMLSMIDSNRTLTPFAALHANQTLACTRNVTVYEMETFRLPNWRVANGRLPEDTPVCGFLEEQCQPNSLWSSVLFYFALALVIVAVAWFAWWYRRWRFERELLRKSWKINLGNLKIFDLENTHTVFGSTNNMYGADIASGVKSSTSLGSEAKQPVITLGQASGNGTQTFQGVGQFDGLVVAVTMYPKLKAWTFKRQELILLKAVKDAQHDNLNTFVGANMDDDLAFTLAWRHCSRGTLEDVLFNDEIHLDLMFKASMMRDIIYGLEYLHRHKSTICCHGALRADTCVVDSRWVVKLTDFGLHAIIHHLVESNCIKADERIDKHMYGMAPELLRELDMKRFNPTPQADMYSFGMVLYQILSRSSLFEKENISSSEILDRIKNTRYLTPFRPEITERSEQYDALFEVVRRCWQESPVDRPGIVAVRTAIHRLTKAYHKNLMDHMVTMLEKYANNLEKIVDERTRELDDQRKRADALLSQLLPKSVANCLKAGQPVPAETFDSVTVFFSDIMDFTSLCSISHPMDVVNMLNLLYSETDAIIAQFDAYKVETIGDAYLVVSGLPERNGNRHVTEIANMSLKIRKFVRTFVIAHLPSRRLEIRIGIHTGPVATGVIGVIMPRYCLFGDTVNVASRMESTGESMKIQISQLTKDLLSRHSHKYSIQPRGLIEVKGKGLCETFWLEEGIKGQDKTITIVDRS